MLHLPRHKRKKTWKHSLQCVRQLSIPFLLTENPEKREETLLTSWSDLFLERNRRNNAPHKRARLGGVGGDESLELSGRLILNKKVISSTSSIALPGGKGRCQPRQSGLPAGTFKWLFLWGFDSLYRPGEPQIALFDRRGMIFVGQRSGVVWVSDSEFDDAGCFVRKVILIKCTTFLPCPIDPQKSKEHYPIYIGRCTATTQKTKNFGKPWETLATVGPIPRHLERAEAVARFRLTTGHGYLGMYLHWLSVATDEACPLCGHARMDGNHLLQCTRLDEYPADDIVSRYWEARCQMVRKPSTGVG
ncbi:reverse transcriptase [Trichonephila clavipes]|nr:reverse transcriptase [Trichonephila clavipes]